jgi:hypothetical protein
MESLGGEDWVAAKAVSTVGCMEGLVGRVAVAMAVVMAVAMAEVAPLAVPVVAKVVVVAKAVAMVA